MTICRLAGLPVAFHHRSSLFPFLMREYLTEDAPLLTLSVSDEEIAAEVEGTGTLSTDITAEARFAYQEALALYRKVAEALPAFGGLFLHAALLSVDGQGVAITAPSGTGKSTHAALWRDLLGARCTIINGDKPLLRRLPNEGFYGFGTPFAGKEGWHTNASCPLRAILFLERGKEDAVTPLTPEEAFPALYAATLPPKDTDGLSRLLPLLHDLLASVKLFRATVTPKPEAARLAFHTVFQKEIG